MRSSDIARQNLERRFAPLRKADLMPPARGWLRAIREALGVTTKQLGSRLGVVPSRITALEKAEVTGGTTLRSLREAAEAMDCILVYAIVPKRPIDELLRARASARADEELSRISHTMRLEDQAIDAADHKAERERLIQSYMTSSLRTLWDRP